MILRKHIRRFVRRVAQEFSPEKVVLFGSYAHGRPTPDSDVDLLVIMPHGGRNVEQAVKISLAVDCNFPMDLIVRTPAEVRRRLRLHDGFLSSVLNEGKTLYERDSERMGRQGRRRLRNGASRVSGPV